MKITNNSTADMKVRTLDGVISISPGRTVHAKLSPEQIAQAQKRQYLTVDESSELAEPAPAKPKSKGRGDN